MSHKISHFFVAAVFFILGVILTLKVGPAIAQEIFSADINGDGMVNFVDFNLVVSQYNTSTYPSPTTTIPSPTPSDPSPICTELGGACMSTSLCFDAGGQDQGNQDCTVNTEETCCIIPPSPTPTPAANPTLPPLNDCELVGGVCTGTSQCVEAGGTVITEYNSVCVELDQEVCCYTATPQ